MEPLIAKAKDLIFEYEGIDQPWDWPGEQSGITIGYGYDLGYESAADFQQDWGPLLSAGDFAALSQVVGLRGVQAQAKASSLKTINIKADASQQVFAERSVPKYQAQIAAAFPGADGLPADVQGALFSLVYNRGTSTKDSDAQIQDRLEMRLIKSAVAAGDVAEIARQLRNMCRLWSGMKTRQSGERRFPPTFPCGCSNRRKSRFAVCRIAALRRRISSSPASRRRA